MGLKYHRENIYLRDLNFDKSIIFDSSLTFNLFRTLDHVSVKWGSLFMKPVDKQKSVVFLIQSSFSFF